MQVKVLIQPSGLRNGKPWPPRGGTIDLPDDEAVHMIGQRLVAPVYDPEHRVETAVPDMTPVEARDELVTIEAVEQEAKVASAAKPRPAKKAAGKRA